MELWLAELDLDFLLYDLHHHHHHFLFYDVDHDHDHELEPDHDVDHDVDHNHDHVLGPYYALLRHYYNYYNFRIAARDYHYPAGYFVWNGDNHRDNLHR